MSWNEYFIKLKKIKSLIFPLTINNKTYIDFYELDIADPILKELLDKFDNNLYSWILEQIKLFNQGNLEINKIKKLQYLGILKQQKQFNNEDMLIYNKYFNGIIIPQEYTRRIHELSIEKQMFLVKEYVDKYYFRKKDQIYSLEDYIQECFISLIEANKKYNFTINYKVFVERIIKRNLDKNLLKKQQTDNIETIYTLEEEIIKKELNEFLEQNINQLPPRMSNVIKQYYYDQLTYKEMMKQIPGGNVRLRQLKCDGLKILKNRISNYIQEEQESQEDKVNQLEEELLKILFKLKILINSKAYGFYVTGNTDKVLSNYLKYGYNELDNYKILLTLLIGIVDKKMIICDKLGNEINILEKFNIDAEIYNKIKFIKADIIINMRKQKCKKMGTIY